MVNLWLSTKNRQRISFYLSKGPGMKCAINVAFDSDLGCCVHPSLHCTKPCRWGDDIPSLKCNTHKLGHQVKIQQRKLAH